MNMSGPAGMYLVSEKLLVNLALVHFLLNSATCDETIDSHFLLLANAPGTLPGLHVCGGVPIWIVHYYPAIGPGVK